MVAAPIAERRLLADLEALAATFPPDTCLAVAGPDLAFAHRADEPMVPASTQKLLTATAALEVLDPQAALPHDRGRRRRRPPAGVVAGDLTLVGGGDPLLATADYAEPVPPPAAALHRPRRAWPRPSSTAGVRRVDGAVVGDEGRYDAPALRRGLAAALHRPGLDRPAVGARGERRLRDATRPPATAATELEPAAQPAVEAAAVLTRLLEARGVDVVGEPGAGAAPDGAVRAGRGGVRARSSTSSASSSRRATTTPPSSS